MGFRDLEERRLAKQLHARRRKLVIATAIAYTLIGVGAGLFLMFGPTRQASSSKPLPPIPPGGIVVSFGLTRETAVRTVVVERARSTSPSTAESPIGVRLLKDPQNSDSLTQFPANQITVGGNLVTPNTASLSVAVDPWSPTKVPAGFYRGDLILESQGMTRTVPLVIILKDRDRGWATFAALVLFVGASVGLVVKWITERLTPQAVIYRRFVGLRRAIGWTFDGRNLPLTVRLSIEEIEDLIARHDYGRAEKVFETIEKKRDLIAVVASQTSIVYDQLDAQAKAIKEAKINQIDRAKADAVLDEEYRSLLTVQALAWPESADEMSARLESLRADFIRAGQMIAHFLSAPKDAHLSLAIEHLQRGEYAQAATIFSSRPPTSGGNPTGNGDSHQEKTQGWRLSSSGRPSVSMLLRLARPIAAVASVMVVTLIGLQTQYLNSQAFNGDLAAWITLGLWGLAVELSGVALVDVLARLGSTGSTELAGPSSRS